MARNLSEVSVEELSVAKERQDAVKAMFLHAWEGYKRCAFGRDEVKPGECGSVDWLHMGITVVDSLDTMWMLQLAEPLRQATEWVKDHLAFDADEDVSLFESTVRVLGGLLSAHEMTNDRIFLEKAVELGDGLLLAFPGHGATKGKGGKMGVPDSIVNLHRRNTTGTDWTPISEICGVQLEFGRLSQASCNHSYAKAADAAMHSVMRLARQAGDSLPPIGLNVSGGGFSNGAKVSVGAGGDSYYEYILKGYLLTRDERLATQYTAVVEAIMRRLTRRSAVTGLVFHPQPHPNRTVAHC